MWAYAEHLLSSTGRVQLSYESILKTDPPVFSTEKGKNCLIVVVAIVNEASWKMRVKRMMTGSFVSGSGLLKYITFNLKRKAGLSAKLFEDR